MEKRLWRVKVEFEMFVFAKNSDEAVAVARQRQNEEAASDVFGKNLHAPRIVKRIADVPADWHDAIPWGGEDALTCEEILKSETP